VQGGGAESPTTQLLVAIDVFLEEIRIAEESIPPDVVEEVGSPILGATAPDARIEVATVGGSQRPVEVPDGSEGDGSLPGLVEVGAEAEGIHIEEQDI